MKWNEFKKNMDRGLLPAVCMFTGPENLIKESALQSLRDALLPVGLETLNDTVLESVTAQQIIDQAETLPMMCDRRIVVVRDWAPLMTGRSKDEESEIERISAWMANAPSSCIVVFYMRESCDSRKKLCAQMQKQNLAVTFDPFDDQEIQEWCGAYLKPLGKKMNTAAIQTLTFMAGHDLTRLKGELEKLIAYIRKRGEITSDDVQTIVTASAEYSVFELINHLLNGDMAQAQKLLNALYVNGESAIGLLALLTRQIRQMTHMKCALDAGDTMSSIQKTLNLKDYPAKKISQQCRKLSAEWLRDIYNACVNLDYNIKSGRIREKPAMDSICFQIAFTNPGNKNAPPRVKTI